MYDAEGIVAEIQANERARVFKGYTGFSDNFRDSIGTMIDEDLSISANMDPRRDIINPFSDPMGFMKALGEDHRSRKIAQMTRLINEGKIPQVMKDKYSERRPRAGMYTDWESLAVEANEFLDADDVIETQAEFEKIREEELAFRRSIAGDTASRATLTGMFGQFAGSAVAGSALEPIAVVTMPLAVPLTGAKQLSKVMYAVHAGKNAALLNVGIQIPIEPFIQNWKEEIGAEYTWKDSVFNLTAAGVFGGVVGSGGAFIGSLFGKKASKASAFNSKDRNVISEELEELGVDGHTNEVLTEEIYEINNAPDKDADYEEFTKAREVRQEEMNTTDLPHDPEPNEMFDATEAIPLTDEVVLPKGKAKPVEELEVIDPLDALLDEVPDDLTFRIDGKNVKVKTSHKPIEARLKRAEEIRVCMING